ncbi:MAG: hypothetical protein RBT11_16140 [Desulfobacterales bacterium]|jgi:hypothetical protein|nr:hypothetical protein [Desulfobacterales bacterium]
MRSSGVYFKQMALQRGHGWCKVGRPWEPYGDAKVLIINNESIFQDDLANTVRHAKANKI